MGVLSAAPPGRERTGVAEGLNFPQGMVGPAAALEIGGLTSPLCD